MEFGKLNVVEKTFTREKGVARGQNYSGIKFRRSDSNKKNEEGVVEHSISEQFIISDKLWKELNLDTYALAQAEGGILLVLEDKDDVKPAPKFVRQSVKRDGTKQAKGKMFTNDYLLADLIASGIVKAEEKGNQYLTLTPIEVSGAPEHVKGVYQIAVDSTVEKDEDSAEIIAAENQAATAVANDF